MSKFFTINDNAQDIGISWSTAYVHVYILWLIMWVGVGKSWFLMFFSEAIIYTGIPLSLSLWHLNLNKLLRPLHFWISACSWGLIRSRIFSIQHPHTKWPLLAHNRTHVLGHFLKHYLLLRLIKSRILCMQHAHIRQPLLAHNDILKKHSFIYFLFSKFNNL